MTSELWWYSARAGGIVAWVLLTASVVWGLVLSTKLRPPRVRPAWTLDLHRFLGGLATIFTAVHVGSIMLDSYTSFGLADVAIPFASSWHPDRVAWGIVAIYLLIAVEFTSLARRYLPRRLWRRVHVLSLPLFALATVHFLVAGTDAAALPARVAMLAATGVVAGLVIVRVRRLASPPARPSRSLARPPTRPPSTPVDAARPLPRPATLFDPGLYPRPRRYEDHVGSSATGR